MKARWPLALPFLIVACTRPVPPAVPPRAVPQVSGLAQAQADPATGGETRAETGQETPRIALEPQDAMLQVVAANLDVDPEEEQVIAVKRREDLDAPIRLLVADADPSQGQYYFQSWESTTNAINARVLEVSVLDLVGDHGREIVVSGMNRDGRLTLDVFRASAAAPGKGISFRAICQIAADEIRIEHQERDEAYALGTRNAASFPIVAFVRDPESRNVMDLVRITYTWKYGENRYVPGAPEKIPGEKVEQRQLEKLFTTGTVPAFEEFLAGSWIQISPGPKGETIDAIVDFQPRSRRISISTGDTQEVYVWRDTLRTIYNRVILIGENEAVPKITKTFSVGVESVSTIAVSIQGSDLGDFPLATYTKVSEDIQARLLARPSASVLRDARGLSGIYSSGLDLVVEFAGSRVTWTEGGRTRTGACVLYTIQGSTILGIRFPDSRPGSAENRSYLASISEKKEPARIVRTLVLTPVQMTVKGYEEALGKPLTLVQTQALSKQ